MYGDQKPRRRESMGPACQCGCGIEQHDCLSEDGECLSTRCPQQCTRYRAQAPASATTSAGEGMFTSEPIAGRQSAFYAGERYIADAELARREQRDLDELHELEAQLTAAGERAERLYRHRFALTPAGRAFVAAMREQFEITLRGRAALTAEERQEVAR
jgi:hypothetical protein